MDTVTDQSQDKEQMVIETIDPEMAAFYLTLNVANRSVRTNAVNYYARIMKKGDWLLNGDCIRFNIRGELVDGQHRLLAVIESGVPLHTYVMYGLPIEAQLTIDQQNKRTGGDMLKMNGFSDGNRLAAIVRMVYRWEQGERSMYGFGGGNLMLTPKEVVDIVKADKDKVYIEATRRSAMTSFYALAPSRCVGTMMVLMDRADPAMAEDFFNMMETGVGLSEGDPVLTLRRYWTRLSTKNAHRNFSAPIYMMAGVRAWNALLEGRKLTIMSHKTNTIPEIKTTKDIKKISDQQTA